MSRLIDADALRNEMYYETFESDTDEQKWDSGCWIRYKMFERILKNQPTIGEWISVKDRMPEENVAVNIAWMNTKPERYYEHIKGKLFVATGVYFRGKWYWWSSVVQDFLAEYGSCEADEIDEAIVITHWSPLPELPEEEE